MKLLNNHEVHVVSGSGEGIYYFEGVSYPFACPDISQECINTYLNFINKNHPNISTPYSSFRWVMYFCGNSSNMFAVDHCMEPAVNEVRMNIGLEPLY